MVVTKSLLFLDLAKKFIISTRNNVFRNICQEQHYTSGASKLRTPIDAFFKHYTDLPLPKNKVFATYVWIDGSGINLRSKDRILDKVPRNLCMIPEWSFDGSSTGQADTSKSDVHLVPSAMYRDPFRKSPHVLVLCETYHSDGKPTPTNHRAHAVKVLSQISDQEPWFGIEQEYTMFDSDWWPLGWPKSKGFPTLKHQFSYCGLGEYVVGREIAECHARACLFSGIDYRGSNPEVMKSAWEYQTGASLGIKAADDLWLGRYILGRIAESFNVIVSYHPKPMGKHQPGIGCHHNFSVIKMRSDEGISDIERVCKVLGERHEKHMKNYGLGDGMENKNRLTGEFETASFEKYKWGVGDRTASVRLLGSVMAMRKGYLEDRRPAGDCDPYRVCALLAETCL